MNKTTTFLITSKDLPLSCPRLKDEQNPLWARHPRVFLDVLKTGSATCPYCGTQYQFSGEKPHSRH